MTVSKISSTSVNDTSLGVEIMINSLYTHLYHERYTPQSMFCLSRMILFQALNQCRVCYNRLFVCVYSMIPMRSSSYSLRECLRRPEVDRIDLAWVIRTITGADRHWSPVLVISGLCKVFHRPAWEESIICVGTNAAVARSGTSPPR